MTRDQPEATDGQTPPPDQPEQQYDEDGNPVDYQEPPEQYYDADGNPVDPDGPGQYYDADGKPVDYQEPPEQHYDGEGNPIDPYAPGEHYDADGNAIEPETPETPEGEAPVHEGPENLVEWCLSIIRDPGDGYAENPEGWCEGITPEEICNCMPEVAAQVGGVHGENLQRYVDNYSSHGHPACTTPVNEIHYCYNVCYDDVILDYCPPGEPVVDIYCPPGVDHGIDEHHNVQHYDEDGNPITEDEYREQQEEPEDEYEENGDTPPYDEDKEEEPDDEDGTGYYDGDGNELTPEQLADLQAKYPDDWEQQLEDGGIRYGDPTDGDGEAPQATQQVTSEVQGQGGTGESGSGMEGEQDEGWSDEDTSGMDTDADAGDDGGDMAPEPEPDPVE